ncbi:MAG: BlaI/MecI/CopY family transcriptional regulator [Gemmatimonadota bacterium]|nr:BlaI/MecI/CopY family transcriptional regulator [Gemmatimonadota bacterium]
MTSGPPRPTNAELEILTVLWERGPSTVRDVHDSLAAVSGDVASRGYTTVLKLMQIMADKGLLTRDESGKAHVYEALVTRESTRTRLIEELAEKAFGGSTLGLALQALSSRPATREEIERVREMLRDIEGEV